MRTTFRAATLGVTVLAAFGLGAIAGDEGSAPRREATEALKPYGPLVGTWRGTGQVQRGRSQGSWTESASWAWKLSDDSASLVIDVEKGKYLKSAVLKPGEAGSYVLEAVLADGSKRTFKGKGGVAEKPIVLVADEPGEGVRRVTLTIPNELRFLILLESHSAANAAYVRLGEVGYTRNGVSFAAGESGPVCVVTEGRGTIQVTYKGKSYYVCCSGCRDLFNKDPEAILAEAAARKKK